MILENIVLLNKEYTNLNIPILIVNKKVHFRKQIEVSKKSIIFVNKKCILLNKKVYLSKHK